MGIYHTLTHLHWVDSSATTLWTGLFSIAGCLVSFYYHYILCLIEIHVFNANSVDLDQMPLSLSVVSDLECPIL